VASTAVAATADLRIFKAFGMGESPVLEALPALPALPIAQVVSVAHSTWGVRV
jgi:hypothetical protein